MASPLFYAKQLLTVLNGDIEAHLERIDRYMQGKQDDPYMPDSADAEYRLLAERAVTNVMPFIVSTPAQAMYVDSFRRGRTSEESKTPGIVKVQAVQPEWEHWQRSGLDAKQTAIYMGAFTFGHSFTLTEKLPSGVRTKGLSALKTAALYEDPANDNDPFVAITVLKMPSSNAPGKARMFDKTREYLVTFKSLSDMKNGVTCKIVKSHGAKECPITRFAAAVDLEGRTVGVVEPMIPLQNRINQTVFDLLIVQSFASFKVRTISGMAPPMKMKPIIEVIDGESVIVGQEPELDASGRPIPADMNLNAKRFLIAEDHDTKFGTLDETPLDGFIKAISLAFRHMAALSQTPPHHILGEIANLSAEALTAAEIALARKVEQFKSIFGESWERVFRIAAQMDGLDGADDFSGEVLWRDMEQKSLAQASDALGKLASLLDIPKRGLWPRVPGVTATEIAHWEDLRETDDSELTLARSLNRAGTDDLRPTFRQPADPEPLVA